jgi:hypothetical protein
MSAHEWETPKPYAERETYVSHRAACVECRAIADCATGEALRREADELRENYLSRVRQRRGPDDLTPDPPRT